MHLLVQHISDCTTITQETTNILINSGFTGPVPGRGGNVLRRLIDRSSALSIHRSFRMRLVPSPVSTCPKRSGWGSSWGPACNKCRPAHSTVSLFSISLTPLTETRSVWLPTGNPLSCAHCHIHCQLNARRCRRANHGRLNFCVPIRNICMRYVRAPSSSENGRKSRDGCVTAALGDEKLKALERSSRADRQQAVPRPRASWNTIRCRRLNYDVNV